MSPKATGKDHFEEEHDVLRLLWGLHVYLLHSHPMTIPVAADEDVDILPWPWVVWSSLFLFQRVHKYTTQSYLELIVAAAAVVVVVIISYQQ